MSQIKKTYRLKVKTITALHIGTGKKLYRNYDYVTQNGKTFVVNDEVLAGELYDRNQANLIGDKAGVGLKVLFPQQYDPSHPVFRYVLAGEPTSTQSGSEVQEQIKDMHDRPYIPGSSLKGAIRTALLYAGFAERDKVFKMRDVGEKAKFAAKGYEQDLLVGKYQGTGNQDPYYDLLRAMQVSDSTPADASGLRLANVKVAQKGEATGAPIELEAVKPNAEFEATLTLDMYLLERQQKALGWGDDQVKWLKRFVRVINYFTAQRLENDKHRRDGDWETAHESIKNAGLAKNEFIMQQIGRASCRERVS